MYAAQWGKLETVWSLLHLGADVNARGVGASQAGKTALDFALTEYIPQGPRPHLHVAQALVLAGAPVDYRDRKWGSTPLMFAAQWGDAALARFLISRGADVHAGKTSNSLTALDFALVSYKDKGPHFNVVEALIEGGVSVDATLCPASEACGSTALLIAAQEGNTDAVTSLISRGADVNFANFKRETALDHALVSHKNAGPHRGVAHQLLAAGAAVERAKQSSACADLLY